MRSKRKYGLLFDSPESPQGLIISVLSLTRLMHDKRSILGALFTVLCIYYLIKVSNRMNDQTEFSEENVPNGKLFRATRNNKPLSYFEALHLLRDNAEYLESFLKVLTVRVPFRGYFFETPGVNMEESKERQFEFVLMETNDLVDAYPDQGAFQEHFDKPENKDKKVVAFQNLGKDALLVAPKDLSQQHDDVKCYSHLASFVRDADAGQVRQLWKTVAEESINLLVNQPLSKMWLSTSGLGVYWLHVRLDSYPKYYTYDPYRRQKSKI